MPTRRGRRKPMRDLESWLADLVWIGRMIVELIDYIIRNGLP